MHKLLSAIGANANATQNTLTELLKLTASWDLSADELKSSLGVSFADLVGRSEAILALARPLSATEVDKLTLVPAASLKAFGDNLGAINGTLETIQQTLTNFASWGGIARIEGDGTIFASNNQSFPFRVLLDQWLTQQDATLSGYVPIGAALRPRSVATFSAATRALQDTLKTSGATLTKVNENLADIEAKIAAVAISAEATSENQAETERLRRVSEEDRKTIEEYRGEAATAKAVIDEVRSEAAALKASVTEYQQEFDAFEKALEKRQTTLREGNEKLAALTAELKAQQQAVAELAGKAEQMLGGATIAGLSSAYDTKQGSVDEQLKSARSSYYASIAFLIVSIFIALNLFSFWGFLRPLPAFPALKTEASVAATAVQILAGLGTRLLIILPALLLAGFATHRHAMLFRLREEYNHKYAIAASVHGFKQQAPQYQEAIAAAVFQELLQNPTSSMDERKVRKENGFLARIIAPQVEAALERMKLIGNAAKGGE